ncbi:hypothetical protein HY621_01180, partial [Candidatus Uhrbacteria bacterium]|nr:hypothetical protein [Candidatus Uhrbacteria bacterium]
EGISLSSLSITAKAPRSGKDDDDLKLLIYVVTEKNTDTKAHRDWYWCGKVLKGEGKKFQKDFSDNDLPTRIDLAADGKPVIARLMIVLKKRHHLFTLNDVKTYSYKGLSGHEDYNRFNTDILHAVNLWNAEFDDDYPPPEPLHPNLVKAMCYIESGIGYFETRGYPSLPDVMQIANPDNPAIHTLNNDGWKSKKGILAQEREWKVGGVTLLDLKGKANGASPEESILWGTRWLYHCAQGITNKGTRYWRPWKEAVTLYNGGGNPTYVQEVYDVYRRGIDHRKNPIKLWSIAFFLLLLGGGFIAYASKDNGMFWLSFDRAKEEGIEYVLTLNEQRGMVTKKIPIATRDKNGSNTYNIQKKDAVDFFTQDISNDRYPEIIVEGVSKYEKTVYVLQSIGREWVSIPNVGEYGVSGPAFQGHDVSFVDIDGAGWQEVKVSWYVDYSNAQDEVWHSWYRYDPIVKAFVFTQKNKEKVTDKNDPFSTVRLDRKVYSQSKYYNW